MDVREWNGKRTSGELIYENGNCCSAQIGLCELVPLNENVEVKSEAYHLRSGKCKDYLFPAVTRYKNELGGSVVVFCGNPRTEYHISTAFSFLNESRKKQMVSLLLDSGAMPVWYSGDAEVCLRAAHIDRIIVEESAYILEPTILFIK